MLILSILALKIRILKVEINQKRLLYILQLKVDAQQIDQKSIFTRNGCTKYREFYYCEEEMDEYPVESEDFIQEKSLLEIATEIGNKDIVSLLLMNQKIDINEIFTSSLKIYNCEHKKKIKSQTQTSTCALNIAIKKMNKNVVELLLSKNNINVNCRSIIVENNTIITVTHSC